MRQLVVTAKGAASVAAPAPNAAGRVCRRPTAPARSGAPPRISDGWNWKWPMFRAVRDAVAAKAAQGKNPSHIAAVRSGDG